MSTYLTGIHLDLLAKITKSFYIIETMGAEDGFLFHGSECGDVKQKVYKYGHMDDTLWYGTK